MYSTNIVNYIRGLLTVAIMLHHYSGEASIPILYFFSISGYSCVALFLFFSGYGNYKSYRKGKMQCSWIIKRCLNILIPYLTVLFLEFVLWKVLLKQETYCFWRNLAFLTIQDQVLWYLKVQLLLYIIFYI